MTIGKNDRMSGVSCLLNLDEHTSFPSQAVAEQNAMQAKRYRDPPGQSLEYQDAIRIDWELRRLNWVYYKS